ncbi:iron chelate uptake ABC transporter family permease subunit [Pseudonocardia sp. NPDC046786]|uniref:iron chelate uptake ABC transporter family permease subunit n=1 Tax=Pseudonocardia sp. NPDC046786 TaxID=3155471 RepID=UPI0033E53B6B
MTALLRLLLLTAGAAVAGTAGLLVGTAVSPMDAVSALAGIGDPSARELVIGLRMPRVLVGFAAGACFGVAGVVLQSVLRNPLASPEVTGVGSGAVLGAVAATLAGGAVAGPIGVLAVAVLGGTLGGGVLWLLAGRAAGPGTADPLRLAVSGVVVSAVLAGGTLLLLTARPQLAGSLVRWLVGSLNGRGWEHWSAVWPVALVVLVAAALLAPVLALLAVDDDHACGVGLAVGPWRSVVVLVAVLATAGAVAVAGALAFVGLLAPHLARAVLGLAGADPRLLVPGAALAGAATVAAADVVAQAVTALAPTGDRPLGMPTGAVTAVAGAVVLIVLVRRSSRAVLGGES